MKFNVKHVAMMIGLTLTASTSVFGLAPVEDASAQQDGIEHGQLMPSASSSSTDEAAAPAQQVVADNQQQSAGDTDNNPLIPNDVDNTASPTLQNPAIGGGDSVMSSLPLSARITRLEQQMQNMLRANTAQQINSLQQQIQQLSGELQVQQHDIKLLNQQLRNFYQDLSAQIKQVKNLSTSSDDSSANSQGSSDVSSSLTTTPTTETAVKKKITSTLKSAPVQKFSGDESSTYQSALNLLMKKKYDLAAKGFNQYLTAYPNGRFVVNAHYWLGEMYALQRQLPAAIKQFNVVIQQYPHSDKVADAKVKLAIIHASQGKLTQARQELQKVKKAYAGSTAAQLASIQLQQLNHPSS